MTPLRLHTKTTLLVSAITLAMFLATLLLVSLRMVNLVREDEKDLARLQALSVAEQISLMPSPHDQAGLDRAVSQARAARPNVIAVRVWKLNGEGLIERAASTDGSPAEQISTDEIQALIRENNGSKRTRALGDLTRERQHESHFHVFAPVAEKNHLYGFVELSERLDTVPSIVRRFAQTAALLAIAAIVLTTLAIYVLFRYLVYRPMNALDEAMARVKAGSLEAQIEVSTQDEFGRLATGFNRMIQRIGELTREREKKRIEASLLRSQRLESLGTLAGGIAHDLNNILSPLSISIFMLRSKVSDPSGRQTLNTMEEVVERGSQLVKQILSFARGVEGERIPLDPRSVMREAVAILKETFPKSIRIHYHGDGAGAAVLANPTQLHQVLMNLCVNARDAMPEGGDLEISVETVELDERGARMAPGAKPGRFVVISVSDTGSGINPEVLDKIFDPFFTTKEQGQGTGLGLSTSLGIVRSHGGFISVDSETGTGALFKVYLPAIEGGVEVARLEEQAELPLGNGELILLVDDEEPIRRLTRDLLEAANYRVMTASDGGEACALYRKNRGAISAALTDMMMPVMDGAETIKELRRLSPELPIIASSGVAETGKQELAHSLGAQRFLSKPYTAARLLQTLNELLREEDRRRKPGARDQGPEAGEGS